MTERLYYDHTYIREFDATVTGVEIRADGKALVTLDRSAFYPTSGGQPFDTGVLEKDGEVYEVTDVSVIKESGEEVYHHTSPGLKTGDRVHGTIDWKRRFDHMQQHGGEHMLAGTIWNLMKGMTIGLHMSPENSTIDVSFPDGRTRLTEEEIALLEDTVNGLIHEDLPVRCWFPDKDELAKLPLRKAPTVNEHVRIVAMGDFEMVACGGTHPSSTGQIGCIKILSVTPERGKARVAFVCGQRAVELNRRIGLAAEKAGILLSCGPENLPEAVAALKEKMNILNTELKKVRIGSMLEAIERKLNERTDGVACFEPEEGEADALTEAVKLAVRKPGRVILTGVNGRLVFGRSEDRGEDMGQLIRQVGKGGGRPDFASGAGAADAPSKALMILTEA